ncbi:MAG TPA: glycosyltransferase family 4 protein [Candidatus Limnocylindrales bacterium]|nr:glycosyltransferase family 4 protein [Candidatus Limnocylindrales bacterium]
MKTKKLHIAIILPTIITKNGTAKQSIELAKVLAKKGHSVSFFAYAYFKESTFPEFNNFKTYYCVDVSRSPICKIIKNISVLEQIYLYLGIFFINKFRDLFNGKKIDTYNPHDWMGLWVVTGLKQVSSIIANINDVPQRYTGILNMIKLHRDKKYKNKIDNIVVLDNINKEKVIKWLDFDEKKISVIRSGIDIKKYKNFHKKYNLKKSLGLKKKDTLLVCANLLAPNRRYEDVLEVLNKYKNEGVALHVLILSKLDFSPEYSSQLKKLIRKYNIQKQVHFIDKFFTDEERMTYIKNSDILIFPNSPQTWGLTVLEAMALGIPVIASTGSGVSEVLHDGIDAIIYPERDIKQLALKIESYLKNKYLFAKIAKKGKIYALNTFSWEKFGTEIEGIMQHHAK